MDDNADQQHLLQNSSHDQTNIEIVEANPLIEIPTNEIQEQKPTEDFPNWDTSLLCQVRLPTVLDYICHRLSV